MWFIFIIALLFVIKIFYGYLKEKIRRTRDSYRVAEKSAYHAIREGKVEYPTWIQNPILSKQLETETKNAAISAGMTAKRADEWLTQQDVSNSIMTVAAIFEKNGFNKLEQIVGACDITKKLAKDRLSRFTDN